MFAASRRAAGVLRAALAGSVLALLSVSGALAVTISESEVGEFSSLWSAPTTLDADVTRVTGTGSANVYDILHFTELSAGAQDLTLTFVAPEGVGESYAAGLTVKWSEDPFRWGWDGQTAAEVNVDYYSPQAETTLSLSESFAGDLYLALYFTHGPSLAYTILSQVDGSGGSGGTGGGISIDGPGIGAGDSVSAVPLPPALALFAAALGALGLAARRPRA